MLTEVEARELYREILGKVGDVLARDIETNVFRGALRGPATMKRGALFDEEVNSGFQDVIPVSTRDALVVALRTLLAALDPIFQLHEVQRVVDINSEVGTAEERKIVWDFDRAALTGVEEVLERDPARLIDIELLAPLAADGFSQTRQRVERLARLVHEFEREIEKGAA